MGFHSASCLFLVLPKDSIQNFIQAWTVSFITCKLRREVREAVAVLELVRVMNCFVTDYAIERRLHLLSMWPRMKLARMAGNFFTAQRVQRGQDHKPRRVAHHRRLLFSSWMLIEISLHPVKAV
jgi:hypothetical protein